MTDQDNSEILNCRTEGCDGTSANDQYWNNTFSVCKECYDEASHDKTRGLFIKWKAAKDAENKVLQDAQAKGMIILMCERIKINKKKGYLRQCIFVKWVIISPFLNLLIDRNKFRVWFGRVNDQNLICSLRYSGEFLKSIVYPTVPVEP